MYNIYVYNILIHENQIWIDRRWNFEFVADISNFDEINTNMTIKNHLENAFYLLLRFKSLKRP